MLGYDRRGGRERVIRQPSCTLKCQCGISLMGIPPSLYWFSFRRGANRQADSIASATESLMLVRTIGWSRSFSTKPPLRVTTLRTCRWAMFPDDDMSTLSMTSFIISIPPAFEMWALSSTLIMMFCTSVP